MGNGKWEWEIQIGMDNRNQILRRMEMGNGNWKWEMGMWKRKMGIANEKWKELETGIQKWKRV